MFRRGLVRVILTGIVAWCGLLLALLGCFEVGEVGLVLAGMVLAAGVVAAVRGGDRAAIRGAAPVAVGTAAVILQVAGVAGVAAIAGGIVAAVVAPPDRIPCPGTRWSCRIPPGDRPTRPGV